MSNMFKIERDGQDQENLSFRMNVEPPKEQFTKCNKVATTSMVNEIKRAK